MTNLNVEAEGVLTGQDGIVFTYAYSIYHGRVYWLSFFDHTPGARTTVVEFEAGPPKQMMI